MGTGNGTINRYGRWEWDPSRYNKRNRLLYNRLHYVFLKFSRSVTSKGRTSVEREDEGGDCCVTLVQTRVDDFLCSVDRVRFNGVDSSRIQWPVGRQGFVHSFGSILVVSGDHFGTGWILTRYLRTIPWLQRINKQYVVITPLSIGYLSQLWSLQTLTSSNNSSFSIFCL